KRLRGGVTRTLDVLLLVDSFFDNRITIESKGEKQYRMANESSKKNIPISEDDLLVAATLIKDADACRNIEFRREHCKIRSYNFYNHIGFKIVLRLCIWIHLLLALCEQPAVDVL
ncbi:hypothetical protein LSH36_56g03022, partial [Paralvinella palmiformis]